MAFADPVAPRILLVKTSSMGDVLHNLPVVTDIRRHFGAARIDWVVEESFAALPRLHAGVKQTLTVAIRRWRKSWWQSRGEIKAACAGLRAGDYELALDTQGLLKSALLTRCAGGGRCGLDWNSAREPLASLFYDRTFFVPKNLHAVERNRLLAAQALGYSLDAPADYGLAVPALPLHWLPQGPYAVFLHATSRNDKLWTEANWVALGLRFSQAGLRLVLPWGNDVERARSERLCAAIPGAICAPRLGLDQAAALLGRARAAVGVDTGLSHLAAALGIPTVGIYTATDPGLTGLYAGERALNLGGKGAPPAVKDVIDTLERMGVHV